MRQRKGRLPRQPPLHVRVTRMLVEPPHPARILHVAAVEVVEALNGGEARARIDGLQERAVLAGRASSEIIDGPRNEGATLLPRARAAGVPRRVERVEVRTIRRVDAVRAGVPVAE